MEKNLNKLTNLNLSVGDVVANHKINRRNVQQSIQSATTVTNLDTTSTCASNKTFRMLSRVKANEFDQDERIFFRTLTAENYCTSEINNIQSHQNRTKALIKMQLTGKP